MIITTIKPTQRVAPPDFHELWRYRDLFYALASRDILVRYKQTAIGIAWAVLQPLITTLIYTITFGHFVGLPSDGLPYPIFAFTGLTFWTLFSGSLTNSSNSLVANDGILRKVYFPRLIVPLASTAVCTVDFVCTILCLFGLMLYYRLALTPIGVLLLPCLFLWTLLASLGAGWFLAALNVKYRDVRHALPFVIQLGVFVSPVIYSEHLLRAHAWLLAINPMTGVIEVARWALLGATGAALPVVATSLAISLAFVIGGYLYFQAVDRTLADLL